MVSCGSMGVTPEFIDAAREGLGAMVKRTYGSTEAPTVTTSSWRDTPEQARDTDGHSVGEAELLVAEPGTTRAVAAGARGEVLVRGPELFIGYGEASQTADAVRRGWFATGDLGTLTDDGWLTIVGRLKELIIRGGENIASAEVERVLELHPDVRQAVVVGRPDERLGERVAAFVVGPAGHRRGVLPHLVRRPGGGPLQDPRVRLPPGRGAGAGGGKTGPDHPAGLGRRAGRRGLTAVAGPSRRTGGDGGQRRRHSRRVPEVNRA